jgi:hypothetical protein
MTAMHPITFIGVYGKAVIADAINHATNKKRPPAGSRLNKAS